MARIENGYLIDDLVVAKLALEVSQGTPILHAVAASGIGRTTFYSWRDEAIERINEGAVGDLVYLADERRENVTQANIEGDPFVAFWNAILKAQGEFIATHARNVHRHSTLDWKASAWLLERADRATYGKPVSIDATVRNVSTVKQLTDDEADALIAKLNGEDQKDP